MNHPRSAALRGMFAFLKLVELAVALVRVPENRETEPEIADGLAECTQEYAGELLVSRYPGGALRRENPLSGVIQEERADGALTVSLPGGKILTQGCPGDSLLVFDLENPGPPRLGRMASTTIEGVPSLVYHYHEPGCHHLVEVSSLRYFKVRAASGAFDEE